MAGGEGGYEAREGKLVRFLCEAGGGFGVGLLWISLGWRVRVTVVVYEIVRMVDELYAE